jgi:hypothetical protein
MSDPKQPPPDDAAPPNPSVARVLGALTGEDPEAIKQEPDVALRALGSLIGQAAGLLRDAAIGTEQDLHRSRERMRTVRETLEEEGFATDDTLESMPDKLRGAVRAPALGEAIRDGARRVENAATDAQTLGGHFGDFLRQGAEKLREAAERYEEGVPRPEAEAPPSAPDAEEPEDQA